MWQVETHIGRIVLNRAAHHSTRHNLTHISVQMDVDMLALGPQAARDNHIHTTSPH